MRIRAVVFLLSLLMLASCAREFDHVSTKTENVSQNCGFGLPECPKSMFCASLNDGPLDCYPLNYCSSATCLNCDLQESFPGTISCKN